MNKDGKWSWITWLSITVVVLVVIGLFFFYISFNPRNEKLYSNEDGSSIIANPISGKSIELALGDFNEDYIYYMLYKIEAYNLHNPPLSKDTPKIEIQLEDETYNAEITNGIIKIYHGKINNKDVIMHTTKKEIVLTLQNESYAETSFNEGRSRIELVEDKTTLFAKGYLNMYKKLTGRSITGSAIRIYFS